MSINVYEVVTNRIMELLQEGTVPWKKPWKSTDGPRNLISKKPYRGINSFLLNCSPYGSDHWLTYNQAKECGGQVRKGEKSTVVIFWKWLDAKADDEDKESDSSVGRVPLLRYYRVFNLEQVDGIDPPAEQKEIRPFNPIDKAEQIIESMPNKPIIQYGGDRAYYRPFTDIIQLPPKAAFTTPAEYYSTCYHELAHSTGHASRVGRKGVTEPTYFGTHLYQQEELVAEFTASMLCGVAGIEQSTIENSAAYIQGWINALKSDKKAAVLAAAQAQRAADYILRREPTQQQ